MTRGTWRQWWIAVVLAVATCAVALGSVYVGALSTREAAQETSLLGADGQRQKESREQRGQVYADYLAAARDYRAARDWAVVKRKAYLALRNTFRRLPPDHRSPSLDADLKAAEVKMKEAEIAFEPVKSAWAKQVDLLFVYGTEDALHRHAEFSKAMHTDKAVDQRPEAVDTRGYLDAESAFKIVFCREASAIPRQTCLR